MPRLRAAVVPVAAIAATAGAVTALLGDDDRRERLKRSSRVWRLTARRGGSLVWLKVRGSQASDERRAKLEEDFVIRTAEDVAKELGNMKGAIMKAGQMISFIAEGLPAPAQAALATLQADVPPMAPSLAEQVVREELGGAPLQLFLDWNPLPVAAASIGQVHKAVMPDGRLVAVKVQYPGVDRAIKSDLDNAEMLYGLFSSMALKSLDVKGLVDELRARMADELDYRIEARSQAEFARLYRDHPFVHVPDVIAERSTQRVLTSEWVDGMRWDVFLTVADDTTRRTAAEVMFRFAQESVNVHGVFNGDPHPGNYRFHPDGSVTFLDFGLVKRWTPGELEQLMPVLDALLQHDAAGTTSALVGAGFLRRDHRLDPQHVWEYVSGPYVPFLSEEFAYSREWTGQALAKILDINGPYAEVIRCLNMPPSFVILDRVVWGMSALMGRIGATGPWRGILAEYRKGSPSPSSVASRPSGGPLRAEGERSLPPSRGRSRGRVTRRSSRPWSW